MSYETHFASVTADHGPASELVHVSPIFARCGPCTRGRHEESRLARVRRTEARWARRNESTTAGRSLDYTARVEGW